jgi:predicted ferric reductase
MDLRTKRSVLLAVYLLFIFGPLLILLIGPRPAGRELWREISVGIGFFALGLMGLQTLPAGRLPFLRDIYPMDIIYTFHHRISVIAFFLALSHPIILFINNPATLRLLNFETVTWRARAGVLGIIFYYSWSSLPSGARTCKSHMNDGEPSMIFSWLVCWRLCFYIFF